MAKITKGRLTRAIKSDIELSVRQELKKLFDPIEKRGHEIGIKILKQEAGEHWDVINKLPSLFIQKTNAVYMGLSNEERKEIIDATGAQYLAVTQSIPLPDYMPGNSFASRTLSNFDKSTKKALMQLLIDRELVNKQFDDGLEELRSVMANAKTVQKLLELWPEVENYLPEEPEKVEALPAVQTTTLDSLLPVEEQAA